MIDKELMDISKQRIIESGEKITPEVYQRKKIINLAKMQGCEMEARQILDRTDRMMQSCKNPKESQEIAIMGIAELHKLLNMQGELNINGIQILPAKGEVKDIIV